MESLIEVRLCARSIVRSAVVCVIIPLAFGMNHSANGQVPEADKAVLAFDVYLDRLGASKMAKQNELDGPMNPLGGAPTDLFEPEDVRRLFGSVSAPPNTQAIQNAGQPGEPLPFDFFLRMQFKSQELGDKFMADVQQKSETTTIQGKTFFRPPADSPGPSNIVMQRIAPDTFEFGTERYLLMPNRNLFSSRLAAAWPKMPRAAVRVALDLDGARHLIDEGLKSIPGGVPAPAQPAVALVNSTSVLRLGLDLTGENLFWLTATARDEASANQVNGILGGLLAMGKQMGQGALQAAPPAAQKPGTEILNALVTQQDGVDVSVTIPLPEGLEEASKAIVSQIFAPQLEPLPGFPGP